MASSSTVSAVKDSIQVLGSLKALLKDAKDDRIGKLREEVAEILDQAKMLIYYDKLFQQDEAEIAVLQAKKKIVERNNAELREEINHYRWLLQASEEKRVGLEADVYQLREQIEIGNKKIDEAFLSFDDKSPQGESTPSPEEYICQCSPLSTYDCKMAVPHRFITLLRLIEGHSRSRNCAVGIPMCKMAIDQFSQFCGIQMHPFFAHLYTALAELYCKMGDINTAIKWYTSALVVEEQNMGEQSAEAITTMTTLAILHMNIGHLKQSKLFSQRVAQLCEQMGTSPKITHIIWDLDGLLVDTEPVYTEANVQAMAKYGKKYTPELKALTMGMKHDIAIAKLIEKVGLAGKVSVKEYSELHDQILHEMLPNCGMMRGAMRLVQHFAKHNIPMAICTGSCTFEYKLKVQKHNDLTDLIPLRVLTGDDPAVVHGKPAPDGFLVTMDRFEKKPINAENVLVFEDSPNGVRSAIAAGMQVVMVPDWSYSKPPEEVKDRISAVLNSLEEFKPETMGLPPLD